METVIKWISSARSDEDIRNYMGKHQQDKNAKQLWEYFQAVIEWTKTTFTEYRPMMKGVAFGSLYNNFKNKKLNPKK